MNFLKVFIAFSALIISFPTFSQVDSLSYIEESNKAFISNETLDKEEIEDESPGPLEPQGVFPRAREGDH